MDKKSIRQECMRIRAENILLLSKEQNSHLLRHLLQIPQFLHAKTIMLYVSKQSEADTHHLFLHILHEGKQVVLPRTNVAKREITPYYVKRDAELDPSSFGVMEPSLECKICPTQEIDAIIIPGVAFDEKCNRLGYGLGFYDRFLKEAKGVKIGICADAQILPLIPVEEHDIPMDYVVSEKRTIKRQTSK